MHRMLSLPALCLASLLFSVPAALADSTVTQTVPREGSVSLDPPGTAPTPANPIVVTVTNRLDPREASDQADVSITITKRSTPTVPAGNQVDIVGPQYDISVKDSGKPPPPPGAPPSIPGAFATFDVDASLLLPGFYGGSGGSHRDQQMRIANLLVANGLDANHNQFTELPDGDIRYYGPIRTSDVHTGQPKDVVSYVAQRLDFTYGFGAYRNTLPDVRSRGFKIVGPCSYACTFTLKIKVTQKAAKVLGLKSTVIAKGRFEQLPEVHFIYGNQKAVTYRVPLTSAAKAALKDVPKTVKVIKFDIDADITGPSGPEKQPGPGLGHIPPFAWSLPVGQPPKDDGTI